MNIIEKARAWNEKNKQPWQRKLGAKSNTVFEKTDAFANSGKLENAGKKLDHAGNTMIRGGITMAFWPIMAIWRAFRGKPKNQ